MHIGPNTVYLMHFIFLDRIHAGCDENTSAEPSQMFVCFTQTGRQTEDAAAAAAALVTPHLDHPFVQGELQTDISALLPSCHPRHWSAEQTHVDAYPTNPPFPPADC